MTVDINKIHDIVAPTCAQAMLTDKYQLMTIWHDGSPTEDGTAVTAATVAFGSTNDITLTINGAEDSRIGSSGVIATDGAGYDTYAEIYRDINKAQGWHCRLEGVLGSDTSTAEPNDLLAISCLGIHNAQTLTATTAVLDDHGLVISNRKPCATGTKSGDKIRMIEDEHGAVNKLYYLWLTMTDATAASAALRVYSVLGIESEELVFEQLPSATTVETKLDFTKRPIISKPGHHLVIRYYGGGEVSACSECMVNGKSVIYR